MQTSDKKEVTIGIDIGGTFTKFGFVDQEGNCLSEGSMPTNAQEEATFFLPRLYNGIDTLRDSMGISLDIKGIGIGVPNGNFYKGTVEYPANISWKGVTPLANMVQNHYGVPVCLTNDANAAALGEMQFGVAKGMKNFVMITLGTGLGSGVVVNGELVYGADSFAGEMGHVVAIPDGRQCGCGKKGCLETYASVTGIRRTAFEMMASMTEDSELRNVSFHDLNGLMISQAAMRGDKVALAVFDYTCRILGLRMADVVALLSPEAFIFFGGLAAAKDYFIEPTRKYMEENLMPIFQNKVQLLVSGLSGKNAAVLGSSALMWTELGKRK
jgi:glucokinase